MKNLNRYRIPFNKLEIALIIVLLILILFGPFLLTQISFSGIVFNDTGQIGDTIGGISSPFVNLLAAFLVYKSFTAQIEANLDQRAQSSEQIRLILKDQTANHLNILFKSVIEHIEEHERLNGDSDSWYQSISSKYKVYKVDMEMGEDLDEIHADYNRHITTSLINMSYGIQLFKLLDSAIDNFEELNSNEDQLLLVSFYRNKLKRLTEKYGYISLLKITSKDFYRAFNDENITRLRKVKEKGDEILSNIHKKSRLGGGLS